MVKKESKDTKISLLNFIFTIGMVIYHINVTDEYNIAFSNKIDEFAFTYFQEFSEHIGVIAMCFFFFISGFLYYRTAFSIDDVHRKNRKRIKTLFVPYIAWTTIVLFCNLIMGTFTIHNINLLDVYFISPIDGPLWYLIALLIFLIISPVVVKLRENIKLMTGIFISVEIYLLLKITGILEPFSNFETWWWYDNMFWYLTIYLFGAYIGVMWPNILKHHAINKHRVAGTILIITSLIMWHFYDNKISFIVYSLIAILGSWMIINYNYEVKDRSLFRSSFFIYALHQPIFLPLVSKVTRYIMAGTKISGFEMVLILLIQSVLVIILSIISYQICKILPGGKKIINLLEGGRYLENA